MKIVKFLLIKQENPWNPIFYMCGGCGHAIALRDVETHAREKHIADGVDLFEVADQANAT